MCTARLATIHVVAAARCQWPGVGGYSPLPWTYSPLLDISQTGHTHPCTYPNPPKGSWYQAYLLLEETWDQAYPLPQKGSGTTSDTHPPWTEWLTDACENITFPQLLLQVVIKYV